VSTNTSQTGFINLSEPYIYYPYGPANSEGVRTLDYSKYEGRLVEKWSSTRSRSPGRSTLRKGVKSCAGNEFTADDVLYTFARGEVSQWQRRRSAGSWRTLPRSMASRAMCSRRDADKSPW
jgi:ABC-type transport system substrate-binding protein